MAVRGGPGLRAPEKLSDGCDLAGFDSGEAALDDWLRRRARQNELSGASRTYVVCAGTTVAGFYSLGVGAVAHSESPGRIRRNMPDPVPVMVLARLAVDKSHQGQGIGAALLRDAVARTVQAADIAGIRAILVQAISESAKGFYERHGFRTSAVDPMVLMVTLAEARQILSGKGPR